MSGISGFHNEARRDTISAQPCHGEKPLSL
jgi:hypothetical protein